MEQLAPLQLAKEHLPGDIVDILERLNLNTHHQVTQGSVNSTQQFPGKTAECRTPASSHQEAQYVDWPDTIPVKIPPQPDQNIDRIYLHY